MDLRAPRSTGRTKAGVVGVAVAALAALLLVPGCGSEGGAREWQTLDRLPLDAVPEEIALRPSPRGGGLLSWNVFEEARPAAPSVAVAPDGSLGAVTQVPLAAGASPRAGEVAAPTKTRGRSAYAAGKGGRGIVAFAAAAGDDGLPPEDQRVYAWPTLTRGGDTTFGERLDLGPRQEIVDLSAAVLPSGVAAVLWGTQDGGEEAGEPWRVRLATIRGDDVTTEVLDPGGVDRASGAPGLVATPEGRLVAVWSSVRGFDDRRLLAAVSDTSGAFGDARQQLDGDGAAGNQLAVAPDGTVLATWTGGTAKSMILRPGATRFEAELGALPRSGVAPAPGFTGDSEPLVVTERDGSLVVSVHR